jgi:hypothetical protein
MARTWSRIPIMLAMLVVPDCGETSDSFYWFHRVSILGFRVSDWNTFAGKEENVGIKPTKTVNWNKIFTKVLAKSPNGSMKTRSLMKEVLVVEASKLSPNFPEKKMLEAELLNQLRKSSKFVVEGKVVRLAKPLQQGIWWREVPFFKPAIFLGYYFMFHLHGSLVQQYGQNVMCMA